MLGNRYKKFIYLFVFLIPFYFFFIRAQSFNPLKAQFVQILKGPIRIISVPLKEIKKILYYHYIFDEYKKIKAERDILKSRLIGMDELLLENNRLRDLLHLKKSLVYSSVSANVIGRSPSRWSSSIIIDQGKEEGIKQGMPVVNELGVVGKIAEVYDKSSKVILLIDPQFSVGALIRSTRESGSVSGALGDFCRMKYLNEDARINLGDDVITSKISSDFPAGLLIGHIMSVEETKNGLLECRIKPAVSLSILEEVLVIVKD